MILLYCIFCWIAMAMVLSIVKKELDYSKLPKSWVILVLIIFVILAPIIVPIKAIMKIIS